MLVTRESLVWIPETGKLLNIYIHILLTHTV